MSPYEILADSGLIKTETDKASLEIEIFSMREDFVKMLKEASRFDLFDGEDKADLGKILCGHFNEIIDEIDSQIILFIKDKSPRGLYRVSLADRTVQLLHL